MVSFIFIALGFVLLGLGLLGCFVYKIPGPILSFIGILVLQFGTDIKPFTTESLIICAVAVILCKILEKQAPKLISKIHTFGRGGKIGCMLGSFIGIGVIAATSDWAEDMIWLMYIVGLVVIPFALAVLFEFISNKDWNVSLKSGAAAWTNYLVNTLLQLAISIYCLYEAFTNL